MFHLMKYIWSAREELLYPRLPLLGLGVTAVSLSLILDYCSPSDGVQAEETRPPQHIRAQVYGESHPRTQFERGGVSYDIESVCSSVCPSEITANIGRSEEHTS